MAVVWPLPSTHFDGAVNIERGGSRVDTGLVDILNDLNTRGEDLEAGTTSLVTLNASGDIPAGANTIVVDTSGGAVVLALPLAADSIGRELFVTQVGANGVTINRAGADTIGAAGTSVAIVADGDGVVLVGISATRWATKGVVP